LFHPVLSIRPFEALSRLIHHSRFWCPGSTTFSATYLFPPSVVQTLPTIGSVDLGREGSAPFQAPPATFYDDPLSKLAILPLLRLPPSRVPLGPEPRSDLVRFLFSVFLSQGPHILTRSFPPQDRPARLATCLPSFFYFLCVSLFRCGSSWPFPPSNPTHRFFQEEIVPGVLFWPPFCRNTFFVQCWWEDDPSPLYPR